MTQDTEHALNAAHSVSHSALSAWQKANKHLIKGIDDKDTVPSKAIMPAKLQEGLSLLQTVEQTQPPIHLTVNELVTLSENSTFEDYITAIDLLASQPQLSHNDRLQEACLLLLEALNEVADHDWEMLKGELFNALRVWFEPVNYTDDSPLDSNDDVNEEPGTLPIDTTEYKSTVSKYITTIEQLADRAALDGYSNLQGISLLIVEALYELTPEAFTKLTPELLAIFEKWPDLMTVYRQNPAAAIPYFMQVLRHPDLHLPLTEDEFTLFEQLLADEAANKDHSIQMQVVHSQQVASKSIHDYIVMIEQQAELAAQKGYLGLQDVSLILIEALYELQHKATPQPLTPELCALLDDWHTLIKAYQQESPTAVLDIIKMLHHPDLGLQIADEDYAALKTVLTEDIKVDKQLD